MRGSIFSKYALIFSALIGGALLVSGVLGISFSYQESKHALIRLQQEKAQAAAYRIGQYLFDLEQKIGAAVEPSDGVSAMDQRVSEIRFLRRTPAFKEISLLDPLGKEVLRLSRRANDVALSQRDFSTLPWFSQVKSGRPYRSPIYFRDDAQYMTIAMAVGPEAAGITVAEVDLEFLLEGITRIKVGDSGHAYAVDAQGHLIAHPDIGMVLKHTSMAALPQVQSAIKAPLNDHPALVDAHDLGGKRVLTAVEKIPYLGWFVFVEEPLAEAYRPLYAQAVRSAALVLLGMILAVLTCVALVRKMVQPIHALRHGAKRIGQGDFAHQIEVHTGDELEDLAHEFNRMATHLQESYASLERKVVQRTAELSQSECLLREAQQIAGLGSYVFEVNSGTWKSSNVLNGLLGIDATYDFSAPGGAALIHPDDLPVMRDYFQREMVVQGIAFDKVFRIIRHDDHAMRWVHGQGKVEFDDQGQVLKVHGTLQDITERKNSEEEIRNLAFFDPLTQLPNRRLLLDRLPQLISQVKRKQSRLALLFIDLDKFKPINDEQGHAIGDWLLQAVAQRILGCLRESDTAARIGGDEFVALLPDLQAPQDASAVAEKIRLALAQAFVTPTGVTLSISSSIGVALYPEHGSNVQDLLRSGDDAMYRAKNAGRNTVKFFAPLTPASDAEADGASDQVLVRLSWKPAFACHQPTIDQEHRELFRLANVLLDKAVNKETGPAQFKAAFDVLLAHVVAHFAHEEAILLAHGYAGLAEHSGQHQALVARALKLRRQADDAEVSVGELVDFLATKVVADHMLRVDRAFFGLFAQEPDLTGFTQEN